MWTTVAQFDLLYMTSYWCSVLRLNLSHTEQLPRLSEKPQILYRYLFDVFFSTSNDEYSCIFDLV